MKFRPHHRFEGFDAYGGNVTDVFHHVICRHEVEVEIYPAQAELNFKDERSTNLINKQIRFDAIVYNSCNGVDWEVRDLAGSPGAGSIDASGLYQAPPKGSLTSGLTDVVVATSRENPLRKAFAWVTLIGQGPEAIVGPTIEIWPKRINLYYPQGADNDYIDDSNKMQLFRSILRHSSSSDIDWLVNGSVQQSGTEPTFLYQLLGAGVTQEVTIRARINAQPSIYDDAKVIQLNYLWPGL